MAAEGESLGMFSGGEPTIPPTLLDFIDAARARPIRNAVLNTKRHPARADGAFVRALADRNVTVYLQQ